MTAPRDKITELIKKIDGVAAVNLAEPSAGDLERVVKAYAETRNALDAALKEVDEWREREAACCPEDVGFDEFIKAIQSKLAAAEAECERLRISLAGCGVAALCNTEKSLNEQLIGRDNPHWSASYGDVVNAVKREIALREENAKLREQLAKYVGEKTAIAGKLLKELPEYLTLEAKLTRAAEALKYYEKAWDVGIQAREALKEIEGEG